MVFARCSTDPISTPPMVSLLADLDLSIFGAILGSSQKSENQKRFHTKLPGQHSGCSSHGSPLLRSQFQGCRRLSGRAATEEKKEIKMCVPCWLSIPNPLLWTDLLIYRLKEVSSHTISPYLEPLPSRHTHTKKIPKGTYLIYKASSEHDTHMKVCC